MLLRVSTVNRRVLPRDNDVPEGLIVVGFDVARRFAPGLVCELHISAAMPR